jgi:hypothetical protein
VVRDPVSIDQFVKPLDLLLGERSGVRPRDFRKIGTRGDASVLLVKHPVVRQAGKQA